jgi:hypothetical protein
MRFELESFRSNLICVWDYDGRVQAFIKVGTQAGIGLPSVVEDLAIPVSHKVEEDLMLNLYGVLTSTCNTTGNQSGALSLFCVAS